MERQMMRVVRLAGHVVASADSEGAVEYSYEELRKHASRESCWIAIDGGVYDVTGCIDDHPGGAEILLSMGGTDATGTFQALSKDAVLRRFVTLGSPALRDFVLSGDDYYAGKLVGAPVDPATADDIGGGVEDDSWIVAALRASGDDAALPTLGWEEIMAHDTPGSLWVVVDGAVFDMTDFPDHPGGAEIPAEYGACPRHRAPHITTSWPPLPLWLLLTRTAAGGKDASEFWNGTHALLKNAAALGMLRPRIVGLA
jgi:cytochrome b involved in lipid metabolism